MPYQNRMGGAVIDPLPYLREYSKENPWYNPFMKGPDYAGGIRSILNEMKQREMLKEAKAQKEFENILEFGKLGVQQTEAGTKATAEERLGKQFDIEKDYIPYKQLPAHAAATKWLVDVGAYDSEREASDALKGIKSLERMEEESEVKARGTRKGAPPKPTKPTAHDLKIQAAKRQLDAGIITQEEFDRIERGEAVGKQQDTIKKQSDAMKLILTRMNSEVEAMRKAWGSMQGDKKGQAEQELRIAYAEKAMSKLDELNTPLVAQQELTTEQLTQAAKMIANMPAIKKGWYDWEKDRKITGTVKEKNLPQGTEIRVSPSGVEYVEMNGKFFEVIQK